ncbi:TPA: hypothetical protein HA265_07350 [Candidatus Woesearchaeota archaeon]|nr:hypothetical protein [Candidatus Woesearchaeota archaeon]
MAGNKKPNENVISYIEQHLEKGVDLKKVKRALADAGHPIEAIEEAAEYVFRVKPHLRKQPKTNMIVYGIIIVLIIAAAAVFAYFKITQTVKYVEEVQKVEKIVTFEGMSDNEVLLYASKTNDTSACKHVKDHNKYYYCTGSIWETDYCFFQRIMGLPGDVCYSDQAVKDLDFAECRRVSRALREQCQSDVVAQFSSRNDPSLCDGSVSCLDVYYALNKASLDADFCDIYGSENASCLLMVAVDRSDRKICNLMSGAAERYDCNKEIINDLDSVVPFCETSYAARNFTPGTVGWVSPGQTLQDFQKLMCFYDLSQDLVWKKGFTCRQVLDYAQGSSVGYLSDFARLYKHFYSRQSEDDEGLDFAYWRCISGVA